jgi:hypothetical protein
MVRHFSRLIVGALFLVCLSATARAETKSGPAKLAESKFGPPDDAPMVDMGKTVKLTAKFYITDFFGSKVITAGATVKNTGKAPMFYVFNVAFFDKDNHLLGCASQASFGEQGMKAGEETQLGSLLVMLPASEIAKVASYQATFYESEHKL